MFDFELAFDSDLGFGSLCVICKNWTKSESSRVSKNEEPTVG